jgi:NADH/NAD ratio-sensing transcriptional regulator Rex
MDEETEITTIDEDSMTDQEQGIYHRRMRVLENVFLPKDQRLSQEELADKEKVDRSTIKRDIAWIKKVYPNLWATDQVKHGFAYTMLKVSEMYSSIINDLYDRFWETDDTAEKVIIAKTLNDLMPTYTNSKAHGAVLERIKSTVKDEQKIN